MCNADATCCLHTRIQCKWPCTRSTSWRCSWHVNHRGLQTPVHLLCCPPITPHCHTTSSRSDVWMGFVVINNKSGMPVLILCNSCCSQKLAAPMATNSDEQGHMKMYVLYKAVSPHTMHGKACHALRWP